MAEKKTEKKVSYESQESLYKKAVAKMDADSVIVQHQYKIDNDLLAASMFDSVGEYLDARELAEECRRRAKQAAVDEKVYVYDTALRREKEAGDVSEWEKVAEAFGSLGDYRDAPAHVKTAQNKIRRMQGAARNKKIAFLAVIVCLAAGFCIGHFSGFTRYMLGYAYMKAGIYASAETIFGNMPGFLKADEYKERCEEMRVVTAKLGTEVAYGEYRWKILAIDGPVYTMIGSNIGEGHPFWHVPFDEEGRAVTWKDSSLRAWLNGEIMETIFNEEERSHLLLQTSGPTENAAYGTAYPE